MDCVIWAWGPAHTPDDELPPPMPGTNLQEDEIDEEEKGRIRTIELDERESEREGSEQAAPNTATDDSDVEGESEESDSNCVNSGGWKNSLENIARMREQQPCHSLEQRKQCLIDVEVKRTVDERVNREVCARLRVLEETKERWISLGMMKKEDAHLLESDTGPYHLNIERTREEYFTRKKEEDQRMLEKKAREKEKELQDLQKFGDG